MRINETVASAVFARLERMLPSGQPQIVEVNELPFTMGRSEDCNLHLPSALVSREHAEIVRTSAGLVIRDLGSRNGTRVNGHRPEKSCLQDGDLISIADVELTFHLPGKAGHDRIVTQTMCAGVPSEHSEDAEVDESRDLIHAIRAAQERLLCRGMSQRFQALMSLDSGEGAGYELCPESQKSGAGVPCFSGTECRLTERLNEIQRLWGAEQSARLTKGKLLLLRLESAEVGADHIPESLARLQSLSGGKKIVASIAESAVVDIPYFHDFVARLRAYGVGVAYSGFAGNQHHVMTSQEMSPDFLILAPILARGADKSKQRQEQIREIVAVASQRSTRVIATGIHNEAEAEICREIGCLLGLGDHFGLAMLGEAGPEGGGRLSSSARSSG